MSDYMSRDETISTIWNVFNSYGNSAMHFEVEETKAIRKFCSRLQREIELLPRVDEKEIIRKPMQDIVERLKEYGSIWAEYQEIMSKDEIAESVLKQAKEQYIRIVKEVGGMNESEKM